MRRAKWRGAITLLVTTLLLAITLMLVLGSYRATLYQIKRAQNEIETRQDHWRAEGGLSAFMRNSNWQMGYLAHFNLVYLPHLSH
ncbi:hypothetical protein P4S52_14315 [Vibrio sp. SA48]